MASKRPPQCEVSEPQPVENSVGDEQQASTVSNQAIQDQMNAPARASFAADGSWVRLWGFPVGESAPQPTHTNALSIAMQQYGDRSIVRITGHASPEGAEVLNESLAYNRAAEVADAASASAETPLVTCGESQGVAVDQYPFYRAVRVEYGEEDELCEPFPAIVQETIDKAHIVRDRMIVAAMAYRSWKEAKYEHIRARSAHRQAESLAVLGFWAPNRGAVDEMQEASRRANARQREDGTKRPEYERALGWAKLPAHLCEIYVAGLVRTVLETPQTLLGPGPPPNGVYVDELQQEFQFAKHTFEQERIQLEGLIRLAIEDGCVTFEQLEDLVHAQLSSSEPPFE